MSQTFSPREWLASRQGRFAIMALAACLSLPGSFALKPELGIDASWQLSLQLATEQGKVFGRDFVFTYGPLGFLLIHAAVNKAAMLLYDFFVLGSLLCIYAAVLPARPRWWESGLLLALALVTKGSLSGNGAATLLFTILCYWLWRAWDRGDAPALCGSLAAALVLFFGKANYGLLTIFLLPAYGAGLLALRRDRMRAGLLLLLGFPAAAALAAIPLRVDLLPYARSAVELSSGYNEAMFSYPPVCTMVIFELACAFLLGAACVAYLDRRRLGWREQAMALPLLALAALLMFKNAFTRTDAGHASSFYAGLPLLLAVWLAASGQSPRVRALVLASLFYPLALLAPVTQVFGPAEMAAALPISYFREAAAAPWMLDAADLQAPLLERYPQCVLPARIRSAIGKSTVDVMPWESSIAVLNGLDLEQRPVLQSYAAYTPWLDALDARFFDSPGAPDFVLYTRAAEEATIDGRPSAWDESQTKRALLENYTLADECALPMRTGPSGRLGTGAVYLLKHTPGARRLVLVSSQPVSVELNEPLSIPATPNLCFLTLEAKRNFLGKLQALVFSPAMLAVAFEYGDGTGQNCRAVLPILKTRVEIDRRVESAAEIRNWLAGEMGMNPRVLGVQFHSADGWAFQTPMRGTLEEYRVEEALPK